MRAHIVIYGTWYLSGQTTSPDALGWSEYAGSAIEFHNPITAYAALALMRPYMKPYAYAEAQVKDT